MTRPADSHSHSHSHSDSHSDVGVGDSPNAPRLIDTHAHLNDERLRSQGEALYERAAAAGVVQIIGIGTTGPCSAEILAIARSRPGLFAAVGLQPNNLLETTDEDWETVVALSRDPLTVAIGETGLDRYWKTVPFPQQQTSFEKHIELADRLGKPLVIHCRDCETDIIEQLRSWRRPIRGVLHSFTGTVEHARAFLDLGLFLSFAGMVTFSNKTLDPLRTAAAYVPEDRILIKTDSPYLSPQPARGKTNEPARVIHTAQCLASLRGVDFPAFAAVTTRNARTLFALPLSPTLTLG